MTKIFLRKPWKDYAKEIFRDAEANVAGLNGYNNAEVIQAKATAVIAQCALIGVCYLIDRWDKNE